MDILYITLGIIASISILLLAVCYVTYRMTFYRSPKNRYTNPKEGIDKPGYIEFKEWSESLVDNYLLIPFEDVYITSHDGLRLHGKYYHVKDGYPVAIQLHGYKSTPARDFSGGGVMAMELGFNVLMIEHRAHEGSEGNTICFGGKEKLDCLSWIDYVIERFGKDVRIMLHGMSMGAATVLLTTELDLPENVLGAVADCPYSRTDAIIKNTIRSMGLPPTPLYPLVRLGGIIFGGIDASRVNPSEAVKNHKIPILIIHGEGDTFVPSSMSDEIFKGISGDPLCSLNKFENAEHGISWLHDKDRYYKLVEDFSRAVGAYEPAEHV